MTYYRYTDGEAISEYTGFAMFTKNEDRVDGGNYGSCRFTYDGTNGVELESLKERFIEMWEDCKDCAQDYMQNMTAEEFFQAFDPDDIVDDAGAWDNSDFRLFFNEFIYNDEAAILLSDGAIVFDENLISSEK